MTDSLDPSADARQEHRFDLVAVSQGVCHACGKRAESDFTNGPLEIEVQRVSATERGFEMEGHGRFHGHCPVCGMQVNAVSHAIPVHAVGLTCNSCGQPDDLGVKVRRLSTHGRDVEFVATLECRRCHRKNSLRTLLGRLSQLLSIEVGLTGITLKTKSNTRD